MKIVTLSPEQFDRFASKHRYRSFYQSSAYARAMLRFGYSVHFLGFVGDKNTLIGATFIAYKEVFMSNKIAYAPRGILFDFIDSAQVKKMVDKLKEKLGKQGFMLLRIDPYIPVSIRSNEGNLININNQEKIILENLKSAGFEYKGKNLYFENEKPRWEALVLLNKPADTLFENFDKRTRNKIRKATNTGLEVVKDQNKSIKELYPYIKGKEKKPFSYYQELVKRFDNNIDVYYAKINAESFVLNSQKLYEQELQNNEQLAEQIQSQNISPKERTNILNKKMESDKLITVYKNHMLKATEILKKYPKGIIIGGAIVINYDNAAHILVEGFNDEYSSLNANYLLKWQMICDYSDRMYKYVNLGAVVGNFEKENKYSGLNEIKLGFNAVVSEYIGEFDVVLNNFAYNLFKNFKSK